MLSKVDGKLFNCLSSCVCELINVDEELICESDLYSNKKMVSTKFNTETKLLETNIEDKIFQGALDIGISIKSVRAKSMYEFDRLLMKYKGLIINVDTEHLVYSETFRKNNTSLRNHFINVYSGSNGSYNIHDLYIPSSPLTSYKGLLEMKWSILKHCKIYTLDYDEIKKKNEEKIYDDIIDSIENYKNNQYFSNDISNIIGELKSDENNINMLDLAASLSVSGIYSTRELLLENTKKISQVEDKVYELLKTISDTYFFLKISLMKFHFGQNNHDLMKAIDNIKKIQKMECDFIIEIEKILNNITVKME